MLTETARDWLENLLATNTDTYAHLKATFEERYIQPTILRFRSAREVFGKKQENQESVDVYANRLQSLAKRIQIDDQTLLYGFLNGIKPKLVPHVLGKNPKACYPVTASLPLCVDAHATPTSCLWI